MHAGLVLRSGHIARLDNECEVLVARTPELLRECFRLRHQVYCLEKHYETVHGDQESDEFDGRARHILLIHRASGQSVGTVRIIPASPRTGLEGLPMHRVCAPALLEDLPTWSTGEISRFAVSKQRRLSCGAGTMIRLGLIQGLFRLSGEMGLTHWSAIMEPILLRLLRTDGIHFDPLGPLVDYHGPRQPSACDIGATLERMREEHWDVWNYVTLGGTLWREPLWHGGRERVYPLALELAA